MMFFNLVCADRTQFYSLRVYQKHKFNNISVGRSYKFINAVNKGQNKYWVVASSLIAFTSGVDVPEQMVKQIPLLPEEQPLTGVKRKLNEASLSDERSTITGKSVQASPVKYRRENLAVRLLNIKDPSGTAKVCLFGDNAEMNFEVDDGVEISGLYRKTYMGKQQLTSSRATTCRFQDVEGISIAPTDIMDDDDFLPDDRCGKKSIKIQVTDIMDFDVYHCCPSRGCYDKKLVNNKCPTCGREEEQEKKSCRVQLLYSTCEKTNQKITIWKGTLSDIIKQEINLASNDDFLEQISGLLPISFEADIIDNKFVNIK
ncbi:uncharacterized protein LOC134248381 isoform X3 [Saccostrea cucullata]